MLRGMDIATSGMIATQRRQDLLTNNVANSNTPGYKQDISLLRAFPDMLLERLHDGPNQIVPKIGTLQTGVYEQETLPLFNQGDLTSTDSPYDVAIEDKNLAPTLIGGRMIKPSAFFAVQTPDGLRFTRNGHFSVNSNNQLITANGSVVLQENGTPVSDPELGSGDFLVRDNGEIIVHPNDPARMRTIGKIGIAVIDNPNNLIKEGNDLYRLDGATAGMLGKNTGNIVLHQKMLEQSNVDLSQTMSDMTANIRLFEANQKVLQAYDKTLEQLNTIGRV